MGLNIAHNAFDWNDIRLHLHRRHLTETSTGYGIHVEPTQQFGRTARILLENNLNNHNKKPRLDKLLRDCNDQLIVSNQMLDGAPDAVAAVPLRLRRDFFEHLFGYIISLIRAEDALKMQTDWKKTAQKKTDQKETDQKKNIQKKTDQKETDQQKNDQNKTCKEETRKEETGKEETCKDETGKEETGKQNAGKEETDGKEIGKNHTDKQNTGNNETAEEENTTVEEPDDSDWEVIEGVPPAEAEEGVIVDKPTKTKSENWVWV
ncbi:hypothetical protein B0T21DRAFT_351329 [Apiosordaria backusii]|uniref:Uncharacterized protein n=1 Tax=Apiosordaria backusii TaxID=314023 RepID=A0AA40DYP5_9PEZI|nr:hypothetical protein B0T21DRAFT_351329 [Apiosordaria backusii]